VLTEPREEYYRPDLALVHHLGFGHHADVCAPGILALLKPVGERGGTVLELGCGSGLLTRHLVDAGLRVIATDASPAMLDLALDHVHRGADLRRLVLPDDSLPAVDAVVSVGHVLSYLPTEAAIDRALVAAAGALRPGGLLALDLCDLAWAETRRQAPTYVRRHDDWVIMTEYSIPSPDRFVRHMTTFIRNPDGSWRRDDERHVNVLIDTAQVPKLLAGHGVEATVGPAFGTETLPAGLMAVIGRRPG
jgi:SAM-dependent methyltransferase